MDEDVIQNAPEGAEAAPAEGIVEAPAEDQSASTEAVQPEEGEAASEDANAPAEEGSEGDDPEPDGSDAEAWRAWRDRESNRIAIARQVAVDAATTQPAEREAAEATSGEDVGAPPMDGAAHPLVARFETLRTALQEARTNHDWGDGETGYQPTPGETQLESFAGELATALAASEARLSEIGDYFRVVQGRALLSAATDAATQFKAAYGVEINPTALMGMAQNGGAAAWAVQNGIDPNIVVPYLTSEAFLSIAEAKLGSQLRKARVPTPTATEKKAPLPSVKTGGEVATEGEEDLTPQEISRRARMEARAGQGVS